VVGTTTASPAGRSFLHPKQAQGIVVQMAETDGSDSTGDDFPPGPRRPSRRARARLRLVARSEGPRRQWVELLGGQCEARAGELVLRWPESPLRIAVVLDPAAPVEGPRAIELSCARRLALPEGPHPVFGAAFTQVAE
jgi:hypothetical protein